MTFDLAQTSTPYVVSSSADLRGIRPDDPYLRATFPVDREVSGWALGQSVAWCRTSSRRGGSNWLNAIGNDDEVAVLVDTVRTRPGTTLDGANLPRSLVEGLTARIPLVEYNAWDWFVTTQRPPHRPGEDLVRWATTADEPDITALLQADSPTHSARPGDPEVVRWCVLQDASGVLLGAAAHTEMVPGVPHLASVVTRADQRGRGLGAAVTAWLTRAILREGAPEVTLGMYADNGVARTMYRKLGYADTHHFASGWFGEPPDTWHPAH